MEEEIVTLRLPKDFVGQMLDGLQCREDAYRATAEYLEDGSLPSADFVIEEMSDAQEAHQLADAYAEIIRTIQRQRDSQIVH